MAYSIDRNAEYRRFRARGYCVEMAKRFAAGTYVIGHTQFEGQWVPVLATDINADHKMRARKASAFSTPHPETAVSP